MSFALSETGRTAAEIGPARANTATASADGPRPALLPLVAAICGIAVVAAIKLVHLWLAQASILDFSL
ncbi:MAG: hypothetical protein WDZ83_08615 [Rhizobiaceae bacterium]